MGERERVLMKIDNRRCQDMMMFPTVVLMKHKKESRENWGNLCFVAYTQGVSFISVHTTISNSTDVNVIINPRRKRDIHSHVPDKLKHSVW